MTDPVLNVEATRELASAALDPFAPTENFDWPENTDPPTAMAMFQSARENYHPRAPVERAKLEIALRLVRLAPRLGLVPTKEVEPHALDFHFARIRCLLAGLGYNYHAPLAEALAQVNHQCPLSPTDTFEEWEEAHRGARRICGWPIGLLLLPWRALTSTLGNIDTKNTDPLQWQRVLAAVHLLKHVRTSAKYGVVVTYNCGVHAWETAVTSTAIVSKSDSGGVLVALGAVGATVRHANPCSVALASLLWTTNRADLLQRRPLSILPGNLLCGPWSAYRPDALALGGFVQHGLKLDGVWVAEGGRVLPADVADPSTEDIIGVDWNPCPSGEANTARITFENALVQTYDPTRWPSEVLQGTFPNLRYMGVAHACLLDATMIAQVMRSDIPELGVEYPLLIFLPSCPTPDDSTNQGKTTIGKAVLNALAPGAKFIRAREGGGAPQQRTVMEAVQSGGTIGLDEFRMPSAVDHAMGHENLQSLCTGGEVASGRVFSNEAHVVRLGAPLVLTAKALPLPPDLVNRSFVYFLDNLTAAQRNDSAAFDHASSGRLSLEIRLAALAAAEAHDLTAWLMEHVPTGTNYGTRWLRIRALAAKVYAMRTGETFEQGIAEVDGAVVAMTDHFNEHLTHADRSGLLSILESGRAGKLRVAAVFEGLTETEAALLVSTFRTVTRGRSSGGTAGDLLRARARVSGHGERPLSDLMRYLLGTASPFCEMSNRAITLAFMKELRAIMPQAGRCLMFPDFLGACGWRVRRLPDVQVGGGDDRTQYMFTIENENANHETNRSSMGDTP